MADTLYLANNGLTSGNNDGSSPANAFQGLLAGLINANPKTIGAGDRVIFECSGLPETLTSVLNLADLGWSGAGHIVLRGNLTDAFKIDPTKYSFTLHNVDKPFYIGNAPNIRYENFHLYAPRGSATYAMFVPNTIGGPGAPDVFVKDSIIQMHPDYALNNDVYRIDGVDDAVNLTYTIEDSSIIGAVHSAIYANYTGNINFTFTRSTMETGRFMSRTSGGTYTVLDSAIDKTGEDAYVSGSGTFDYCATNDGFGTNATSVSSWPLEFINRPAGDLTLSQSASLFGQGSTGNNIGSDQTTVSTNPAAFTSFNGGATVTQTTQGIPLVFSNYGSTVNSCIINDIDHSDLLTNVTATGATLRYVRRLTDQIGTETFTVVLGDGTISRGLTNQFTTTFPYSVIHGFVDSNGLLAGVRVTNADAVLREVSGPSNGIVDYTRNIQDDINEIYTPNFGYVGSDSITIEVYDPNTDVTNQGIITLTVSGDSVAPSFLVPPTASSITENSLSIGFTADEAGTYRFVLVADGSNAPSIAEVLAGTGAGGALPSFASAPGSMLANTAITSLASGLVSGTSYDAYVVITDQSANSRMSSRIDVTTAGSAPDTQAPDFSNAPALSGSTETTITFTFTPNAVGSYRVVALPSGATAPTATEVLGGTGAGGVNPTFASALSSMSGGITYPVTVTGLTESASYDIYVALTDASNNVRVSSALTGTTVDNTAPLFTAGPIANNVQQNTATVTFTSNESGTYRLVVVPDGDTAPTVQEVFAGQASGGASPVFATSTVAMGADTSYPVSIIGLNVSTAYDVYIGLSDSTGNMRLSTVVPITTIAAGNNAPVFTSSPVTAIQVGGSYSYTLVATDADGDTITYTAPTIPSWLTLVGNSLTGTPATGDAGSNAVILRASDGTDTADQTFSINVSAAINNAPVFTSQPPTSASATITYSYTPTATDADGDTLSFTAPMLPSWLTFSAGQLSGTPTEGDVGDSSVTIRVTDGVTTVDQSFTIAIVSQRPRFTSIAPTTADVDVAFSYTPTATDAQGNTVNFTVGSLPSWLTFSSTTLSGTPTENDTGTYTIVITASDGSNTSEQVVTLVVTEAIEIIIDDLNLYVGDLRSPDDNEEEVYIGFENKSVISIIESNDPFDLTRVTRVQLIINSIVVLDSDTGNSFSWGATLPQVIRTKTNVLLATLGDAVLDPGRYYSHIVLWIGSKKYLVTEERRLILDVKPV